MMRRRLLRRLRRLNPAVIVIFSFLAADLIGAVLLDIPLAARAGPVSFIDALFTSTSALCVTGLATVDIGTTFTAFGQVVIMALMEIGGLGVMTFSVLLFLFLGRGFSSRGRWIITETFMPTPIRNVSSLLKSIFLFTFVVEGIGAVLLFIQWRPEMKLSSAIFAGVFHSVSAFCNAGLALFRPNFMAYRGSILLNATVCSLIVLGGIGFPVVHEFINRVRHAGVRRRVALSLHSRTVLTVTLLLIVSGSVLVFALERDGALAALPMKDKVLASIFQSITARTAGFNTLDIGALGVSTLFILVILMFIGASPGSCGGGIKTTSLAVLGAIVNGRIRGRQSATLFKRTVPDETISRALSIFILAVVTLTVGLTLLLVTQTAPQREHFLTYLFEAVSAFGTVGLSMGITPSLGVFGKLIIVVLMLIGRVGLLTIAYVVTNRRTGAPFRYAEEKVMIG